MIEFKVNENIEITFISSFWMNAEQTFKFKIHNVISNIIVASINRCSNVVIDMDKNTITTLSPYNTIFDNDKIISIRSIK